MVGYHPRAWRRALVVVIPKPNRDDLTAAKNYRPISLLETISKLIEKGVSKRLLFEIRQVPSSSPPHNLGHANIQARPTQGSHLVHDVQAALRAKWHCGALLVRHQGVFRQHTQRPTGGHHGQPRISLTGMVQVGTLTFLSEQRVTLSFNGEENAERDQPVGTPQGSPVSPVLSAIYTSPLLCKPRVQLTAAHWECTWTTA
jgi:hypothetical protein